MNSTNKAGTFDLVPTSKVCLRVRVGFRLSSGLVHQTTKVLTKIEVLVCVCVCEVCVASLFYEIKTQKESVYREAVYYIWVITRTWIHIDRCT